MALVTFTRNTQAYLVDSCRDVFVVLVLAQEEIPSVLISVVGDDEDDVLVRGAKAVQR